MIRIEQEQRGLMLMDAGTPGFSGGLLDDSIEISDPGMRRIYRNARRRETA